MNNLTYKSMQDLLKNYELQMNDYKEFIKSKIWSQITSNSFKNIDSIKLSSFFSNNLSDGIDNSRLLDEETVKKLFLSLCDKYNKDEILKLLVDENNNIGNSQRHYSHSKKIISYSDIFHVNFYYEIEKYISKKKTTILEIGGGYGGLARMISNNKDCIYILIDLPEINLISSYYLTSHFPNKKFLLYEEYQNNKVNRIEDYDFVILPPWSLNKNIKPNFCINIRSMMEMNIDSINKYFKYIHESLIEDGYFLNVNRYFTDGNKYNFYFYKFPYDKNWKIIKSKTAWSQKNIHFLLTKKSNVALNDMDNFLKKLKDFTIKRYLYRNNIYYKIKIFLKNLTLRLKKIIIKS